MGNNMKLLFVLLAAISFTATPVFADIQDRINECEEMGGNECIFDLLRELGARGSGRDRLKLTDGKYKQVEGNCRKPTRVSAVERNVYDISYGNTSIYTFKCDRDGFCNRTDGSSQPKRARILSRKKFVLSGFNDGIDCYYELDRN